MSAQSPRKRTIWIPKKAAGLPETRADAGWQRWKFRAMLDPIHIADDVWQVQARFPGKNMNVYLIRDGSGVLAYDTGIRPMWKDILSAAEPLGGLTRVILGHAHFDHRGAARRLGVPVICHPDELALAEGDGGASQANFDLVGPRMRVLSKIAAKLLDGGPVRIDTTMDEGDEVSGFKIVHLPGHTPGLIGLWRAHDRMAIVSDCLYSFNVLTGEKGAPRIPHPAFNFDTDLARMSIRKLAAMDPASVWLGHADPLTVDVPTQLNRAANHT